MSKMNFKEHLANYVVGNYGYSYLIQVAIAGLLDGYESEHLAILAGEDENEGKGDQHRRRERASDHPPRSVRWS